jgi:hypothetical protein
MRSQNRAQPGRFTARPGSEGVLMATEPVRVRSHGSITSAGSEGPPWGAARNGGRSPPLRVAIVAAGRRATTDPRQARSVVNLPRRAQNRGDIDASGRVEQLLRCILGARHTKRASSAARTPGQGPPLGRGSRLARAAGGAARDVVSPPRSAQRRSRRGRLPGPPVAAWPQTAGAACQRAFVVVAVAQSRRLT